MLERGQVDRAIDDFQKALELSPDLAQAHVGLGGIFANRGQLDRAADQYRKALKIKPDAANTHYNLGVVLNRQGKSADAIVEWREALRLQPDNVDALDQLAWVLATSRGSVDPQRARRRSPWPSERCNSPTASDATSWPRWPPPTPRPAGFRKRSRPAQRRHFAGLRPGQQAAAADAFRAQRKLYQVGTPYRDQPNPPHR